MALNPQQWAKNYGELVSRTRNLIDSGMPKWYILDTSGLLFLSSKGVTGLGFALNTQDSSLCLVTDQVFDELRAQYTAKRRDDQHKRLCPYTLIDAIYQGIADGALIQSSPLIDTRIREVAKYGMKKGQMASGVKVNSRVSDADISLIASGLEVVASAAGQVHPIIVGSDSDVPSMLIGIKSDSIGYLPAEHFIKYIGR